MVTGRNHKRYDKWVRLSDRKEPEGMWIVAVKMLKKLQGRKQ